MNKKLEEAVAGLRCVNKPVKSISKTLGVKKDEIEKIIKHWIINTNPFLDELVKNRKARRKPNTKEMLKLVKMDVNDLLKNDDILDYIAVKRNDYHDRFMDCIRYKINLMLENENKK